MAAPATPANFVVNQGDGRVALTWQFVTGATSYNVYRSTDQITYTVIASPLQPQYEDTSVTLGTLYYYKVSALNGLDESPLTTQATVVPTMGGEMSLLELSTRCRQRADREFSDFVGSNELTSYINQSQYELYDLLIAVYEDYFKAPNATFYSTGGTQKLYPVPNGVLSFIDDDGNSFVPPPCYKLLGLDLGLNVSNNGWVSVDKYNFIDRNRFFYPNSASTIYGVFNCQYRWMGANLEIIPVPSANQPFRIQYIPKLKALLLPQDTTSTSISGWLEYVITDVAIKILQKEESDVSALMAQKLALKQRIEQLGNNKDTGRPDTISDVRGWGYWNRNSNFNGQSGGW
jgi:hypothetical protein